jgi:hypothetical protein
MKISKADNLTPDSSPPPRQRRGQWVWESLTPRLIGLVKATIIETLLYLEQPLSPVDLRKVFPKEISLEQVRDHTRYLAELGVLEVVGSVLRPDGKGGEPTYFFPKPPRVKPAPRSSS